MICDLSVSGMKLKSEKNLNGDEGRNAEAGAANVTPTESFEEGDQTLTRPDNRPQQDPQEPGEDLDREQTEKTQETSERSEVGVRKELLYKGTFKSETKINSRRKEQSILVKEGKNAMMSRIIPREEHSSSKAKQSFKTR